MVCYMPLIEMVTLSPNIVTIFISIITTNSGIRSFRHSIKNPAIAGFIVFNVKLINGLFQISN